MTTVFLLSYFSLWVLVIIQSLLILVLLRQVGILHLRIAPVGARMLSPGPDVGQLAPSVVLQDIDNAGQQIVISDSMPSDILLLFMSPTCPVCKYLIPAIKPLVNESRGRCRWAIVSSGSQDACRAFRNTYGLHYVLFVCSSDLHAAFKLRLSPYAILINKEGLVTSKGLVNQIEHLESILEPVTSIAPDLRNTLHLPALAEQQVSEATVKIEAGIRISK